MTGIYFDNPNAGWRVNYISFKKNHPNDFNRRRERAHYIRPAIRRQAARYTIANNLGRLQRNYLARRARARRVNRYRETLRRGIQAGTLQRLVRNVYRYP